MIQPERGGRYPIWGENRAARCGGGASRRACVAWATTEKKDYAPSADPEKSQSGLARLLSVNECEEDIRVSRPALIKMLIICAAMLTIQFLVYFAYQPVWSH